MCEEEIKKVTASVFKYILPKSWSKERKEKDPITAERVVEAIKAGKDVEIINAVIEGPFILKSVNAEGEVTIKNTTIRDPIDWSYATFKRVLNLENSIFEFETDATFTAVTVDKDIFLDEATFCGKAVFADITVMGAFYSRSTTFKKDVIFEDGIFKKRLSLVKALLWVRPTLEVHELVVMRSSWEPSLRNRLISIVPRSVDMLFLSLRICLT